MTDEKTNLSDVISPETESKEEHQETVETPNDESIETTPTQLNTVAPVDAKPDEDVAVDETDDDINAPAVDVPEEPTTIEPAPIPEPVANPEPVEEPAVELPNEIEESKEEHTDKYPYPDKCAVSIDSIIKKIKSNDIDAAIKMLEEMKKSESPKRKMSEIRSIEQAQSLLSEGRDLIAVKDNEIEGYKTEITRLKTYEAIVAKLESDKKEQLISELISKKYSKPTDDQITIEKSIYSKLEITDLEQLSKSMPEQKTEFHKESLKSPENVSKSKLSSDSLETMKRAGISEKTIEYMQNLN